MKKASRSGIVFLIVFSLVILPFCGSLGNVAYAVDIGNEYDNTMKGDNGDNEIYGEEGNDTIKGKDGDDDLYGGDGDDYIYGGDGSDDIYGDRMYDHDCDEENRPTGIDHLYGGEGNDNIKGGRGDDYLYGNSGEDDLRGGDDNDELHGGADNDTLRGGDGDDDLYGNSGDDDLRGGDDNDELHGGIGNDELRGGDGDDDLYGDGGHDELYGGYDDDDLYGGNGHDQLSGGQGNDKLYGENGRDELWGSIGDDELYGGEKNDELYGGPGSDIIDGGNGRSDYTRLQGEIDDYDIVISGDSQNTTLTFEQVNSFDCPPLRAVEEDFIVDEDFILDTVTNVEIIDFGGDDEDEVEKTLRNVEFIPLDGTVDRIVRNSGGTYTVYWGYENNNKYKDYEFEAYEDENYFLNSDEVNGYTQSFDYGDHNEVFITTSDSIVQKWKLGDSIFEADASGVEKEFQKWYFEYCRQNSERDGETRSIVELWLAIQKEIYKLFEDEGKADHAAKDFVVRLAKTGLFEDFEAVVKDIDENITVGEAIELLSTVLGYDLAEKLELDYEEDDILTIEVMVSIFTAAFELDEEDITDLGLQVTDENKEAEITNGQFYIHLVNCLF